MKFFEKRGIAFAALVLAIAAAVFIGQSRKAGYIEKQPSELPQVEYHQWICDDAGMLTDTTKDAIRQYNSAWDSKYYAIVAVATVDSLTGWTPEEAALQLGADWNLGANDMLLMMVRNDDYYVACGDNVLWVLSNYDTMQAKLKQAIESAYYSGDFDAAALAFYRTGPVGQYVGRHRLDGTCPARRCRRAGRYPADRRHFCGVDAAGRRALSPLPPPVRHRRAGGRGTAYVLSHLLGTAPPPPSAPWTPAPTASSHGRRPPSLRRIQTLRRSSPIWRTRCPPARCAATQ